MAVKSSRRRTKRHEEERRYRSQLRLMKDSTAEDQPPEGDHTEQDVARSPAGGLETQRDGLDRAAALDLLFFANMDDGVATIDQPGHDDTIRLLHPVNRRVKPEATCDSSKRSLFSLPAEIRLLIYADICTTCLKDVAPVLAGNTSHTRTIIPADFSTLEAWSKYNQNLSAIQASNAQLRNEFTPVWAEHTVFRIHVPDLRYIPKDYRRLSRLETFRGNLGIELLRLLRQIGPDVSRYTPEIQMVCTWGSVQQYNPQWIYFFDCWRVWLRTHSSSVSSPQLECCEDVHPDLVLRMAYDCIHEQSTWDGTICFQQGDQGWYEMKWPYVAGFD